MTATSAPLDRWRAKLEACLEDGKLELPVLPEVAQAVVQATHDAGTTVGRLAEQIRRDPALAANVLRLANSSFYGGRVPIVSLQHALSRLGLDQVRQIALVIACEGAVFSVPGHITEVRALFRHSLATACVAGEIARAKRRNVEEAYLGGLLHAVGLPVLLQLLGRLETDFQDRASEEFRQAAIEAHAAALTTRVLTHWCIADAIREAVQYLHDPHQAPGATTLAATVALARDWGRSILQDPTIDEIALREHPLNETLTLYPDDIQTLWERREKIAELVSDLA